MDDYGFGPEDFEARFGISKERYEQQILALTRGTMEHAIHRDAPADYADCGIEVCGSVVDVRLEGDGGDTEVVVLFHLAEAPGMFGWRSRRLWPAPDPNGEMDSPESLADLFAIDLVETVQSTLLSTLLRNRDAEGTAWI